jgi:hypothetical protein
MRRKASSQPPSSDPTAEEIARQAEIDNHRRQLAEQSERYRRQVEKLRPVLDNLFFGEYPSIPELLGECIKAEECLVDCIKLPGHIDLNAYHIIAEASRWARVCGVPPDIDAALEGQLQQLHPLTAGDALRAVRRVKMWCPKNGARAPVPRGRPRRNAGRDRRILDAWGDGKKYPTYAACARALGGDFTEREVKLAVDAARKKPTSE